MDTAALKKFMRPNVLGVLCFTAFFALTCLFGFIMMFLTGDGHNENRIILFLLLFLVVDAFFFYALAYCPLKVYRERLDAYAAAGELESLAAEFRDAQEAFNRGRLRLGSRHIFVQGECVVFAYEDIQAINIWVDQKDNEVTLTVSRKDQKLPDIFRSVKWRLKDEEIQDAVSAIIARNPEIQVRLNRL